VNWVQKSTAELRQSTIETALEERGHPGHHLEDGKTHKLTVGCRSMIGNSGGLRISVVFVLMNTIHSKMQ